MILTVPNVAEGRDFGRLSRLAALLDSGPTRLLDWGSDLDHNRAVFTLVGEGGDLARAIVSLASLLSGEADISEWEGVHPTIGILDVAPFVWLQPGDEAEARAAAQEVGESLGAGGIPVFLYGSLATSTERSERAWFRRGGFAGLVERMGTGELEPDFGPSLPHPAMGATLVTARPPMVAFNIEIEGCEPGAAARIASRIRESGGGHSGLRAIGLELSTGREQVSMNVGEPGEGSLGVIAREVAALAAEEGGRAAEAELVGLVPEVALARYPAEIPIREFDPEHHLVERRLASLPESEGRPS